MMAKKKAKKPVKKATSVKSSKAKKRPVKKAVSAFRPRVETPAVVEAPKKPKKNYKLPNYKKKCIECAQFKFIKGGWSLCMQCYEKRYGKYMGEDRFLYIQQK